MKNEPVAWMVNSQSYTDTFEAEHYSKFTNKPMIPLYIHPKELTEEILWGLAEKHLDTDHTWGESNVTGIGDFIEAILRNASGTSNKECND
jgi:hypothetical protein